MATSKTTTLPFGARLVTVPRLNVGALRQVRAELLLVRDSQLDDMPTIEEVDAMTKVVFVALQVTEPQLTLEQFTAEFDALDYDDGILEMSRLFAAVVSKSGINQGLVTTAGEAAGAAESAIADVPSISVASTG